MPRLRLVLTTLFVLLSTAPSFAHGGHGGGSVFIGFGGFGCCFGGFWPFFGGWGFAPPLAWGWPPPPAWGYAPPAAFSSAPPASAPPPPPTGAPRPLAPQHPPGSPSGAAAAPSQEAWYYCPATRSYYPYVATCGVAWQTVPTTPPQLQAQAPVPAPSRSAAASRPARGVADTPTEAFLRGVGGPRQGEPNIIAEFRNSSGRPCQQLERSIVVDGIHQHATAVVCERGDGRWVISPETVQEAKN